MKVLQLSKEFGILGIEHVLGPVDAQSAQEKVEQEFVHNLIRDIITLYHSLHDTTIF